MSFHRFPSCLSSSLRPFLPSLPSWHNAVASKVRSSIKQSYICHIQASHPPFSAETNFMSLSISGWVIPTSQPPLIRKALSTVIQQPPCTDPRCQCIQGNIAIQVLKALGKSSKCQMAVFSTQIHALHDMSLPASGPTCCNLLHRLATSASCRQKASSYLPLFRALNSASKHSELFSNAKLELVKSTYIQGVTTCQIQTLSPYCKKYSNLYFVLGPPINPCSAKMHQLFGSLFSHKEISLLGHQEPTPAHSSTFGPMTFGWSDSVSAGTPHRCSWNEDI